MRSNRRLFGVLTGGRFQVERKVNGLTTFLPTTLFCLFLGFGVGNLFGTFLAGLRHFFHWDGFIILSLLGFIEITNYAIYHSKLERNILPSRSVPAWKICHFLKIGLMLGFFIDAFKVGS